MRLRFERALPVPCAAAWPYLTTPTRMNTWSEAEVTLTTPGADGQPDGVGARRTVRIRALGMTTRLDEVVLESEPPHRFVYRVTSGGALRDHRGEITLSPTPTGAHLCWEVAFSAVLPGLAPLLARALRPRLARSLAALEAVLRQAEPDAGRAATDG